MDYKTPPITVDLSGIFPPRRSGDGRLSVSICSHVDQMGGGIHLVEVVGLHCIDRRTSTVHFCRHLDTHRKVRTVL